MREIGPERVGWWGVMERRGQERETERKRAGVIESG